jgi:hypothetical protein
LIADLRVGTSISFRNVLGAPHKPEEKWCLGRTMKQRARKKYYFEIKKTWSENACMVVCKYIVERTRPELAKQSLEGSLSKIE